MRWTKLNTTFDADPVDSPRVLAGERGVQVIIWMNPSEEHDVLEGEKAEIYFRGAHCFRVGSPNDEGFYRGQCRFSKSGLPWGAFYELHESGWETTFPVDKRIISPASSHANLKHYLWHFHDETFECIAEYYEFRRLGVCTS